MLALGKGVIHFIHRLPLDSGKRSCILAIVAVVSVGQFWLPSPTALAAISFSAKWEATLVSLAPLVLTSARGRGEPYQIIRKLWNQCIRVK